ncbi:MAG: hypothetical protein ACTSWI_06745 [Alphaproteobacteria bacterium]
MNKGRVGATCCAVSLIAALIVSPASGQDLGVQLDPQIDFWDLRISEHISEQPTEFQEYACGTNGGPPSTRLTGLQDFMICPAEDTGLHEVQFRYDDMIYYWALAYDVAPLAERYAGTRVASFNVIVSVLVDDEGIVRGLRAVTDNRASTTRRGLAYSLANAVQSLLGGEGWGCVDRPVAEGEEPFGGKLIKEDCVKTDEHGSTFLTQSRLLRKPGQTYLDPNTRQVRTGYFESIGRVEIYDATIELPPL